MTFSEPLAWRHLAGKMKKLNGMSILCIAGSSGSTLLVDKEGVIRAKLFVDELVKTVEGLKKK